MTFVERGQLDDIQLGGIFVAGLSASTMVADGCPPDRHDTIGTLVCLSGMAAMMYVARSN
ncbi:hypothetical protein ACIO3O_08410 [Streptomyces sp. NPDC087440]|uniref:hypothetical protein n=1 Tax=Streptomyces sp. NPDC087440 TaxID=3365790 RepID=UPI00380A3BDC